MSFLFSCIKTFFWASSCSIFFKKDDNYPGICPYSKKLDFCLSSKLKNFPFCTLGEIEFNNQKSYFTLDKLLREPFFRYFKVVYFSHKLFIFQVNLKKDCPFWDEAMVCFSDQCAVNVLSEEPVIPKSSPRLIGDVDSLNEVKFPKFQQVLLFHINNYA